MSIIPFADRGLRHQNLDIVVNAGGSIMGFPYMDPLAGGIVGIMIAYTGAEMVWQSVADLTDTVDANEIRELERIIGGWVLSSLQKKSLTPFLPWMAIISFVTFNWCAQCRLWLDGHKFMFFRPQCWGSRILQQRSAAQDGTIQPR